MAEIRMGLRLLETLTSALYDDPIILFREYVQNSVDAYNKAVEDDKSNFSDDFSVNITINKDDITIEDNGYGIPKDMFSEKMTSIGASDKSTSPDQIGFRGIGRLSAMPFCANLIFTNKPIGLDKCLLFSWDGSKFHHLLNQSTEIELGEALEKITDLSEIPYEGDKNDHFFKVTIQGYNPAIRELLAQKDFKNRLQIMLPLKYDPDFQYKKQIRDKYLEYMGGSLDKFSFIVRMDGEILYKPYKDSNILESGINFWELRYRSTQKGIPGDKIGLLWYTFNRKVTANPQDEPYGILVRSKNMLMGDHNSLADAMFRGKNEDYVATFRELAQTLRGVYGEMLIHYPKLNDNARRDWFRPDSASMELRDIIFDFMKRLHNYRYVASKAFNAIETDKNKQKLTEAFVELTSNYEPKKFVDSFYKAKQTIEEKQDKTKPTPTSLYEFADEDIPRAANTIKRFYDKIIMSLRNYYTNKNELQEFLKVRSYVKKQLNEEQQD